MSLGQDAPVYLTRPSRINIPAVGQRRIFASDGTEGLILNSYYEKRSDNSVVLLFTPGGGGGSAGWLLDGNTNGAEKYIGTNDAFDFPFYTNGTEVMRLKSAGGVVGILRVGTATTVGIPQFSADINIEHGVSGIDFLSMYNHTLGIGNLFVEEGALGMFMLDKDGTAILDSIHIFPNGGYSGGIRMDNSQANITFTATGQKLIQNISTGYLSLFSGNGVADVFGKDGSDLRIGTDANGTDGKGIYIKAYSSDVAVADWTTMIKTLNVSVGRPNLQLLPDGFGNLGINNVSAFGTGAVGVVGIGNGTEPGTAIANGIQIYSVDSDDATATLGLFLEQAVEAVGTFTGSNKIKVKINGALYWIELDAV